MIEQFTIPIFGLLLFNLFINVYANIHLYGILSSTTSLQSFRNAQWSSTVTGRADKVTMNGSLFNMTSLLDEVKTDVGVDDLDEKREPFVFTDLRGMKSRILKEVLHHNSAFNASDKSTFHNNIHVSDALSGPTNMSAHLSVVREMLSFLDKINHPPKPITIFVDDTKFGHVTLTMALQDSLMKKRKIASFDIVSKTTIKDHLTKQSMIENTILFVDSDGEIVNELLTLSKAMGLAGKNGIFTWILSERTKRSMKLPCVRPEGNYFSFRTIERQLTVEHLINAVLKCQNSSITGNSPSCIESHQRTEDIHPLQMWTDQMGAVWSPLTEEQMKALRDYQIPTLANPLWPKLRVAVAKTYEPWIVIVDVNKTFSTEDLCGMDGRFGYRYTDKYFNSTVGICAYGVAIDILKVLEKKLEFVPQIHVSRDGLYGSYNDDTKEVTGVLREIFENKADISMDLMESSTRNKIVDFTTPMTVATNGLVYIQPNKYNSSGVFGPFSMYLWLSIVFGIGGLMIYVWCLERASPYGEYKMKHRKIDGANKSFNASETMNYVWGIFLSGEIIVRKPVTIASRVSLIIFSFVSILIIAAYSGNLITFLVVLDEKPLITGIYDQKLISPTSKLRGGYLKSTSVANYLQFNQDVRLRELFKRMEPFEAQHEALQALKSGRIQIFVSDELGLKHQASIDQECSMRVLPIKGTDRGIGVVSRKGSSWKRRLNLAVTQMTNSGAADRIFKSWFQSKQCTRSVKFYQLGTRDIGILFIWLCYGVACCLVVVLVLTIFTFIMKFLEQRKKRSEQKNTRQKNNSIDDTGL